MKRRFTLLALVLAAILPAGAARAASIGVEAFGGVSIPIVQDDTDQGSQFGVRVPVNLIPLLTVEPYFGASALGNKSVTLGAVTYERDGGDVTAFGLNARLGGFSGPGLKVFPYVGIGSHTLKREGTADLTKAGYNFGLGIGFSPLPKLSAGLRGEFNMIPLGNETSRKFANVTLGVSYNVLSLP